MTIPVPSLDELTRRIYDRLIAETNLNAGLKDSIVGVLTRIMAAETAALYRQLADIARNATPATATGAALDDWGNLLGVPRRDSLRATTVGMAPSVKFTNEGVATVEIPTGIRVYNPASPQVAFFTVEGATLPAGQSTYVNVTAANPGDFYNSGVGVLTKHDLPVGNLVVTNVLPILNGSFRESDESYRERLIQDLRRRRVLTVENVTALLRAVPGVRDVFLDNLARGDGTYDVIVLPFDESYIDDVVSECRTALSRVEVAGISTTVRGPDYVRLDVKVNLMFKPGSVDRDDVRSRIRTLVASRVENSGTLFGGVLYLSALRAAIVNSHDSVVDASLTVRLDGEALTASDTIELGFGEKLSLRHLVVD